MSSNRFIIVPAPVDRSAKRFSDPILSNRAFSTFFIVTILIAIALLLAPKAHAQSSWIGPGGTIASPTTGNFNTSTNWSPTGVPAAGATISFGGSLSASYTATNNISGNYRFGILQLNSTSSATDVINGNAFNIDSSPQIQQNNSGAFTIQNGFVNTNGTILTFAGNGTGLVTLSGIITESNSGSKNIGLTKTGTSTFLLTGNNAYTGGTTIQAGTILIGNNNALGTGGTVLLGNTSGSSAANLLTNGAFTLSRAITLQSGNTGVMTLGGNTAAASSFTGAILLGNSGSLARNATFVALAGGNVDFTGVINENSGIADSSVTIGDATHSGTVKFSNVANNYGGTTTIGNGSTLEVTKLATGGVASSIGNSSGVASNLVLDNGTLKYTGTGDSTNRLFTIGTGGATIDASGSGALNFTGTGSLVASGTGNRTLTITGTNTGANTLASVIANPSSGATSLVKSGTGTWVLTGASTYTGSTTINGGTLTLDNNNTTTARLAGTSGITVNSGGTLLLAQTGVTSTDRINNSAGVTISGGGTFKTGGLSEGTRPSSPSATNGVPGMGALTLTSTSSGSHATIDFATGANGSSLVFTSLSGGNGAFVDIRNWTGLAGTDNGGTGNDRLLFGTNPLLTNAQLANIAFFNDSNTPFAIGGTLIAYGNEFELVPVPEPSTWIGGALALAAVGFMQRRRFARLVRRAA